MSSPIRDTSHGAYLLYGAALIAVLVLASVLRAGLELQETVLAYEVLGILGVALAYRWLLGDRAASMPAWRSTGCSWTGMIWVAVAAVLLGLWANVAMALTVELTADVYPVVRDIAARYQREVELLLLEAQGVDRLLGVLAVCVAAPVCEEVLFRGVLLQEQRKSEAWGLAVVLNGAMFGAFHLNPLNFVPLAIVGVYLAHLTVRSRSLWPAVLAHGALNFSNGVVLPALLPSSGEEGLPEMTLSAEWMELTVQSLSQYAGLLLLFGALAALFWRMAILEAGEPSGE